MQTKKPVEAQPSAWWRSRYFAYGFAVTLTLLTLLLRLQMSSLIGDNRPLIVIFIIPLIISAYIGGLGPGLVATAIAATTSEYFLIPKVHSFHFERPMDFVQWLILLGIGVLASILNEALHRARKRADLNQQMQAITLASIGDAVITTDAAGRVTFLNSEAERLTGWKNLEAAGKALPEVFHIINEATRKEVEDPVQKVFRTNGVVGLANHTILIARDGTERIIDDSGAPIRAADGQIIGVVLVFRDNTEKKRAEDGLRRNEMFLQHTGQIAKVGGWEFDPATGEGNWSEEVAMIHDLDPKIQPSKELGLSFYPGESRAKIEAALKLAVENGTPYDLELEFVSAKGIHKWVRTIAQPVVENGQVVRICGALQDITERRQAESAFLQNRGRLQQVIEHTHCIVNSGYVTAPPGWESSALAAESLFIWDFPVINPEIAQAVLPLELAENEPYEQAWKRSRHPEDQIQMNQHSGQALLDGADFYINGFRCTDKHGIRHWLNERVSVHRIAENRWQLFGITTDVTALKTTEELYRALFNLSPAGFLRQDIHGTIIDANETLCQLTGYHREEILGQKNEAFASARHTKLAESDRQKILAGGTHVHEVENRRSDGRSIFLKLVETCVTFPDGHQEILSNVTDITERKRSEQQTALQKQVLELIASGHSLHESLTALCKLVESQQPGLLASILLLDEDGKHLRHGAAPSLPEAYCQAIDGAEIGPEVGSCGTAAFLKKQIIVTDINSDPLWKNFKELAAEHQLRACWSTPVFDANKKVLATFATYAHHPGQPTPEQLRLMEVATHIAAVAISSQRKEAQVSRLAAIVATSEDAIISKTLDGIITSWNLGAEKIYGYAAEEILGKSILLLFPNDLQTEETEIMAKIRRGESVSHYESERIRKDGRRIHVSVTISPLMDDRGKIIGVSKVARDITEQKRISEQISIERARFKIIFDCLPVGIAFHTIHPDGTFTRDINDAHLKICGITREEHNDQTIYLKISHPDDIAAQKHFTDQVNAGMIKQYSLEKRYLHADGKTVWVNFSYQRETYPDGTMEELTTVVDITELKEANDKIALDQARFKLIFNSVPIGIAVHATHPDGSFTRDINEAHLRICGLTRADHDQPGIYKLISHPDDYAQQEKLNDQVNAGLINQYTLEKRYLRRDGKTVWVSYSFQIGILPDGTREQLTTVTDITEIKRLEEQLRQSQKMEAIGQLSGGIAHDFNNILTAILGNATLLSDPEIADDESQECLQEIVRAARRAADLTRQLLLFSRKQTMQTAIVDLNQVAGRSTKMLQRILGEDITLDTAFSPALPPISADSSMIEQAILNLAVNARDAMPNGGKLSLRTSVEIARNPDFTGGEAQPHACLTVSDTGDGIPPEILPRIFEPFFTTKEIGKGTGLGLATVYGIMQQHKGWITVHSETGRGSTFQIYFPAQTGQAPSSPTLPPIANIPRGAGTILIAEDEVPVRTLVSQLLRRLGYTIIEAENGAEALKLWRQQRSRISLVLTDIIMPGGMTGYDLAARLLAEDPLVKIIFTSGYTGTPNPGETLLQEGKNFIRKPFDPEGLAEIIRNALAGKI